MNEEILLLLVIMIMTVMVGVAVKLHLLSNEAMRLSKDIESLQDEGWLAKNDKQF